MTLPASASKKIPAGTESDTPLCGVEGRETKLWVIDMRTHVGGSGVGLAYLAIQNFSIRWILGTRQYEQRLDALPSGRLRILAESVTVSVGPDLRKIERYNALNEVFPDQWPETTFAAGIAEDRGGGSANAWYLDLVKEDLTFGPIPWSVSPVPLFGAREVFLYHGTGKALPLASALGGAWLQSDEAASASAWGQQDGTTSALGPLTVPQWATHFGVFSADATWIGAGSAAWWIGWRIET